MSIADNRITAYLDSYAESLSTFDAERAAQLWSAPGIIVDAEFSGVAQTREDMVTGLTQSYPLYQRLASVTYEVVDRKDFSDKLVQVSVTWHFLDAQGEEMTDSTNHYVLREEGDQLQACVCIETDSREKLQELMSRKGL